MTNNEDLVPLCVGECAVCAFDEDHVMVTREVYNIAVENHRRHIQEFLGNPIWKAVLPKKEPSIEQIKEVAKKLFQAIGSDPGALSLGPDVRDAAWELHYLLNPEEKIKNQAAHPHDHQDYCEGCQSITDMWVEDTTRCDVCREKYPNGYN